MASSDKVIAEIASTIVSRRRLYDACFTGDLDRLRAVHGPGPVLEALQTLERRSSVIANNSIVLHTIMRPLTRSPPFERWFDVLRSPQISDAPDRAAQLPRYRHARARPGILRIWSTPRRPACSAKRYARNRAYGLPPPVP